MTSMLKASRFACALFAFLILSSATHAQSEAKRYAELPNFHKISATLYRGGQPAEGGFKIWPRSASRPSSTCATRTSASDWKKPMCDALACAISTSRWILSTGPAIQRSSARWQLSTRLKISQGLYSLQARRGSDGHGHRLLSHHA